jgi:hypothetical protein
MLRLRAPDRVGCRRWHIVHGRGRVGAAGTQVLVTRTYDSHPSYDSSFPTECHVRSFVSGLNPVLCPSTGPLPLLATSLPPRNHSSTSLANVQAIIANVQILYFRSLNQPMLTALPWLCAGSHQHQSLVEASRPTGAGDRGG